MEKIRDIRISELVMVVSADEDKSVFESAFLNHHHVIYARNTAAAVSLLKSGLMPSLMVLNLIEDMDAVIKGIKRMAKHAKDTPMLAISPVMSKEADSRLYMAGVTDILHPPVSRDVLFHRSERILVSRFEEKAFEEKVLEVTDTIRGEKMRSMRLTLQLLSSLASTIDAKDEYTKGHSNRVSLYSLAIAKAAECLTKKEYETLMQASLLHDVGKIGISDAIIRKPGKLSDEEYAIIQDHPVIGWNILKSITLLPGISWVARWHHEHYDGGGYPDGLSGDGIPVMVRMVSIADSYDAMTSTRSYRAAMSNETAIAELIKGRGKQFDPYLIDVTIPLIESGEIRNNDLLEDTMGLLEDEV